VAISGRLAWVGMNIDIGDSRTSGLTSDLRAWTARASFDKKKFGRVEFFNAEWIRKERMGWF
jgi:hypothetical protein